MKNISNKRGMGLVIIMLALVIVSFMCYMALRTTKKNPEISNNSFFEGAGVNTSSYTGILESSKKIIKDAAATRAENPL